MKRILFLTLAIVILLSCTKKVEVPTETKDGMWTLVWNDEFENFDNSKWINHIGNGFMSGDEFIPGWGNNELEYYTDRRKNCYVKNGVLVLKAVEEEYSGMAGDEKKIFNYTSARVATQGLFSQTYGRFEIRAKLPEGKGLWPALWMLPEDSEYGSWAASGEIDIMEAKGSEPYYVHGTLHYGSEWPQNVYSGDTYEFEFTNPATDITTWHVYTLEWVPGEIRWYIDNKLYQTQQLWYSNENPYPAPFDKDFYLLMNLAVGGHYDGDPDETTLFPAQMEIDYVRVYEIASGDYPEATKPDLSQYMEERPDDARLPTEDGNEIYNANFDQDIAGVEGIEGIANSDYWYFLHMEDFGGDAELTIEEINGVNFAKFVIKEVGNQFYSIQLIQDIPLIKGHTYRVSFDAKADDARKILVKLNGDADRAWAAYSPGKEILLSTEIETYTFEFSMGEDSDIEARMEYNVGIEKPTVWIGNMRVEDISLE